MNRTEALFFVGLLASFLSVFVLQTGSFGGNSGRFSRNRSQVQGSTFRVKDKGKIRNPQFSRQRLVLPHNCQRSAKFQIGDDAANASLANTLANTLLKWTLGTR